MSLEDKSASNPGILPYPHHVGSSVIKPENHSQFVNRGVTKVNHEFSERFKKLKEDYDNLLEEWEWNKLIYESDLKFEPIVGEIYHLYKIENRTFLSLIEPDKWNKPFLGSFKLSPDLKWIKQ
jgi:hypothetical protein